MRVTLTPDIVRKAKPAPVRQFLWDSLVPGLGLVVHPSGKKSWVFQAGSTGGRRRSLPVGSLAEARKAALVLKTGIDTGPLPAVTEAVTRSSSDTVNSVLDAWLASLAARPVPPSSLPRIQACMGNHVRPRIGHLPVAALKRSHVLAVRDGLAARDLRGMANQVTAYIRAALRWAEDANLLAEAPRWRLPRLRLGSLAHALDDEQWSRLTATLKTEHGGLHKVGRLALLALILTGCRKGEIAALRWDAIAEDGSLLLTRHKTSARNGPKRIPGSDQLCQVIRDARGVVDKLAAAQPTLRLQRGLSSSVYVFPSIARNAIGQPITRALDDTWVEVRTRAQLPPTMTIHGIRAAFITQAQRLGVPVATVAAMVGHESPQTTLRHYTTPTQAEVGQSARLIATWISAGSGDRPAR
jgi:integrase